MFEKKNRSKLTFDCILINHFLQNFHPLFHCNTCEMDHTREASFSKLLPDHQIHDDYISNSFEVSMDEYLNAVL